MKVPLFTVIVPTLNSGKTLGRAISSVLSQTFDNFEIVVADGASSDNTALIVRDFCEPRISFMSEPDRGIYDAMNKGVTIAKGEWLYFMGSDDYLWDKYVLADTFAYIEHCQADLVYGNVFSPDLGENYDGEFDLIKLAKQNVCHQAIFYSRFVFDAVGQFDINYVALGDYDFNIRCFHNTGIKRSFFDRRIAYYAPAGTSRNVDRLQQIKDRYLITNTLSSCYSDHRQFAEVYTRQANKLVGIFGIRNLLLGKVRTSVKPFLAYDPNLRKRMLKAIWARMLNRILK